MTLNVKTPATISFRLESVAGHILSQRAREIGISAHELARRYVIEILQESEERGALREALVVLQNEICELRSDLRVGVEALLTSGGKVTDEDARSWVEENLKSK